jgi:phosphate transport system protein
MSDIEITALPAEGHIRRHFGEQLEEIHVKLVELGDMVLANVRHAGEVVLENRLDEVDVVRAADEPINERYEELDEQVFQMLALQQPVASDLRFLLVSNRMLYEMERSGDLAVNIVRQLGRIDGIPADPTLHSILARLIESSAHMFHRGIEAIATMDPDIGRGADVEDELTDRITSELFSAVTARQDDLGLEPSVALFYIGRFLERIADHGVNMAQHITFAVEAHFPEDHQ